MDNFLAILWSLSKFDVEGQVWERNRYGLRDPRSPIELLGYFRQNIFIFLLPNLSLASRVDTSRQLHGHFSSTIFPTQLYRCSNSYNIYFAAKAISSTVNDLILWGNHFDFSHLPEYIRWFLDQPCNHVSIPITCCHCWQFGLLFIRLFKDIGEMWTSCGWSWCLLVFS